MMSAADDLRLPGFRTIHEAVMAAPPRPAGFPLTALTHSDQLRAIRSAPHLQSFLSELRAEAERARSTPIPPLPFTLFHLFETSGERAAYERPYFDRRRRLLALALSAAVAGGDENLPALTDLIWELCNEYTWALPAHLPVAVTAVQAYRLPPEQVVDLFAAHTAHALAEAIALLGERLDPWLHYRVRTEVERRIFRPLFHNPHHFKWEWEPMNWAAVCAGCAGMAALVLEDDRERLAGMIERVIRGLDTFLEGFGSDGGCAEGIGYWQYGFGFYTYFAEMLRTFTGGSIDLLAGERLRRIAAFPGVVGLGANAFINYSDAAERILLHPGLGSYLAERFRQPLPALDTPGFHSDHVYRWGHVTRDLLWTKPQFLNLPVSEGLFYLPDIAWVVDRKRIDAEYSKESWGTDLTGLVQAKLANLSGLPQNAAILIDANTVAFSARGGHNNEPHNHNDLGHFILHLAGESLLADLGAGVYTRQYFGPRRYEAIHTGSQGHSVPLINGQTQGAGPEYAATVLDFQAQTEGLAFILDLTQAYGEAAGLISFVRAFDWKAAAASRSARLRLTDTFRFNIPSAGVDECFISLYRPVLGPGSAIWSGKGGLVTMAFDRALLAPVIDAIETRTHSDEPLTVYRLRLSTRCLSESLTATFDFTCRLANVS